MSTPEGSEPRPDHPGGTFHGSEQGYPVPPEHGAQQPGYGGPQPGYGAQQPYAPSAGAPPYGQAPPPGQAARNPNVRPPFVLVSTILAMIGAVGVIFFGIVFALVGTALLAFMDVPAEFAWAGWVVWVVAGLSLVWGAVLLIAAILALLQRNWARWVVIVMGAVTVALLLVPTFLGDPTFLVGIIWVGVSVGFLFAPDVNRWYAMRNAPDPTGAVTG